MTTAAAYALTTLSRGRSIVVSETTWTKMRSLARGRERLGPRAAVRFGRRLRRVAAHFGMFERVSVALVLALIRRGEGLRATYRVAHRPKWDGRAPRSPFGR